MRRRDFLTGSAAWAGATVAARFASGRPSAGAAAANRLEPPADARIPVAVTISPGVTVIDFSGP